MSRPYFGPIVMSVALIGAGCAGRVDLEQVPIGAHLEVTRQDGGVVQGTLMSRNDSTVQLAVGTTARSIPRDQISSVELIDGTAPPKLAAKAKFREFTIPDGTHLNARLDSAVGSDTSDVNDAVTATLTEGIRVDGVEVLPAGSVLIGAVTLADSSNKVRGRASLGLKFTSVSVAGRDETYPVAARLQQAAPSTRGDDAKKIGIPAAGGAILGAVLGGKKGAGIGAVIGGGAGAAVVLTTSGREVRLPRGTELRVALDEPVDIRVPIKRERP